jgi:protein TonB
MSRLQKKCFLGSVIVHSLALLLVVVGSAFLPSPLKPEPEQPFLELVNMPDIIVDANIVGGDGKPVRENARPAPPLGRPEPAQLPPPKPARPTVKEPVKEPDPPKNKPDVRDDQEEEPETKQSSENDFPAPKKRTIAVNLSDIVKKQIPAKKSRKDADREAKEARDARERAEAEDREAREQAESDRRARMREIARAGSRLGSLQSSLSTGTDIDMPGGTGPAYAGYALVIKKLYDDAWRNPQEVDDASTTVAEIVIARDGRIISSKIIRKSSNSALDKSVREALDRVRKAPPFPEGGKDAERTFRINFNLKSKTDIG